MDIPNPSLHTPPRRPNVSKSHAHRPEEKVRLMCSYGGRFVPRPRDKWLCYVGGDTRIILLHRHSSLRDLSLLLSGTLLLHGRPFILKYLLPGEDLDSLISIIHDEDLQLMIQEYDRVITSSSPLKPSRLRLFLFFSDQPETATPIHSHDAEQETRFVDATNDSRILSRLVSDASAKPGGTPLNEYDHNLEALGVIQNNKKINSLADVADTSPSGSVSSMFSLPSLRNDDHGSRLKQQQCQMEELNFTKTDGCADSSAALAPPVMVTTGHNMNGVTCDALASELTPSPLQPVCARASHALSLLSPNSVTMFSLPSLGDDDHGSRLKQQQCHMEELNFTKTDGCADSSAALAPPVMVTTGHNMNGVTCDALASELILSPLQPVCARASHALSLLSPNSVTMFSLPSLGDDDHGSRLKQQQCQMEELNFTKTDGCADSSAALAPPVMVTTGHNMNGVTCDALASELTLSPLQPVCARASHALSLLSPNSVTSTHTHNMFSENRIASSCSYLSQPVHLQEQANMRSEISDPNPAIQRDKVEESRYRLATQVDQNQEMEQFVQCLQQVAIPCSYPVYAILPVVATHPTVASSGNPLLTVTPQIGTASTVYNNATPIVNAASNPAFLHPAQFHQHYYVDFPQFHYCPLQSNIAFAPSPHGFGHQSTAVQKQTNTPLSPHYQSMTGALK
ncbi:hypothetical protein QN277_006273 [Acacia crassicarpa]|uniref:PB1 domain-containing protein n=1 Tax=Acacia crassicarpa TaxID=499986 RepID=A0AAE1IS52_9FABA|nr:hypothetical protein QN277_006273 [Acacia crassicarpa]